LQLTPTGNIGVVAATSVVLLLLLPVAPVAVVVTSRAPGLRKWEN